MSVVAVGGDGGCSGGGIFYGQQWPRRCFIQVLSVAKKIGLLLFEYEMCLVVDVDCCCCRLLSDLKCLGNNFVMLAMVLTEEILTFLKKVSESAYSRRNLLCLAGIRFASPDNG